jgi:hypothetical protein
MSTADHDVLLAAFGVIMSLLAIVVFLGEPARGLPGGRIALAAVGPGGSAVAGAPGTPA